MKRSFLLLGLLLSSYVLILIPFSGYLQQKTFVEKLGYTPQPEALRILSADQKQFVAASLVMKVLFYFGSLVEKNQGKITLPPDYFGMYKTIETALKLDPYNMDGYYFAQAILVWDVGRVQEANSLLEYGMQYRDWDWYLPFFAGFNYAYFLKDYQKAAKCYRKAADLTGNELFTNLAGRYLHESGQTEMAIAYLSAMEKGAKNDAIRKTFKLRLQAFREVRKIEQARVAYRRATGRDPMSVSDLVLKGFLKEIPVDPYGGTFFLAKDGRALTTSKFAFGVAK